MPHCIICNSTSVLAYQYTCDACTTTSEETPDGVYCHACGKPSNSRHYCSAKCRGRMAYGVKMGRLKKLWTQPAGQTDFDGEVSNFAKLIFNNHGAGPVTRYRPGDPGFDELAKQYRHPSNNKAASKARISGDFVARKAA